MSRLRASRSPITGGDAPNSSSSVRPRSVRDNTPANAVQPSTALASSNARCHDSGSATTSALSRSRKITCLPDAVLGCMERDDQAARGFVRDLDAFAHERGGLGLPRRDSPDLALVDADERPVKLDGKATRGDPDAGVLASVLVGKHDGARVSDRAERALRAADLVVRNEQIDVSRGSRRPSRLEPPLLKRALEQDRSDSRLPECLDRIQRLPFNDQPLGDDVRVAAHPASVLPWLLAVRCVIVLPRVHVCLRVASAVLKLRQGSGAALTSSTLSARAPREAARPHSAVGPGPFESGSGL